MSENRKHAQTIANSKIVSVVTGKAPCDSAAPWRINKHYILQLVSGAASWTNQYYFVNYKHSIDLLF